jgi:hypothetical protein
MKNLIKISYEPRSNSRIPETTIDFINNCRVTIPPQYGGFVIPSGCGSGKTTAIVDMIVKMMDKGVLYSAATIDECNKMYRMLIDRQVTPDDIIVLHSDYTADGVDGNLIKRNDDMIRERKILICTHYRLVHEHNEVLYSFKEYTGYKRYYTRSHKALVCDISTRQNIFIDEVPNCSSLTVNLNRSVINSLTYINYEIKKDLVYHPESKLDVLEDIMISVKDKNGNIKRSPIKDLDDFNNVLNSMKSEIPGMYDNSCELNKKRNNIISDMIYDNMESLVNSTNDRITLTRTVADMLYSDMMSRIMVFEGTGDLTFYDSNLFKVLNVENVTGIGGRYSSQIYLRNPIPFNIKRSYRNQKEFLETKNERDMEWNKTLDIVESILRSDEINENGEITPCTGTLIQTWKGYNIRNGDQLDYIEVGTEVTENMIPDIVRENLRLRGLSKFEVIHFMSGLDKATNEFRDFNRIIILGNLQVPNSVVHKFNQDYRVKTDISNYTLYQLVQAVCRTRIRNHKGESISIYYTEDWKDEVMSNLVKYLKGSSNESTIVADKTLSFIKPKWRPIVDLFCDLDDCFKSALERGMPYKFNFTLDDIYELIPMSVKEVKKYYPMINYFRKLGVEIKIESERRGRFSKIV